MLLYCLDSHRFVTFLFVAVVNYFAVFAQGRMGISINNLHKRNQRVFSVSIVSPGALSGCLGTVKALEGDSILFPWKSSHIFSGNEVNFRRLLLFSKFSFLFS